MSGVGGGRDFGSMTYADLVHHAEDQRRRIHANGTAIHQKEARLRLLQQQHMTPSPLSGRSAGQISARLRQLRLEASREAEELGRLRAAQGRLEAEKAASLGARSELDGLHSVFQSKEWELRAAASRVDGLRDQLAELQRRRQSAATAAAAMADNAQRIAAERARLALRSGELAATEARLADARASRPKAAVEPFHVRPKDEPDFAAAFSSTSQAASRNGLKERPSPEKGGLAEIRRKATSLFRSGKGPAPPPPPQPSADGSDGGERSSLSSSDSAASAKRAPLLQTLVEAAAIPDLIPTDHHPPPPADPDPQPKPDDKYSQVESDKLHIRLDNIRAAKRRSWASQNPLEAAGPGEEIGGGGEAEHIRRMLAREQARGKSNINFSWVFDAPGSKPRESLSAVRETSEPELRQPPPYPFVEDAAPPSPQAKAPSPVGEVASSSCSPSSSDAESVVPSPPGPRLPSPPPKGILKTRKRTEKRNIEFDPLALLLDAALEGELELVKRSAQKLDEVSKSNDEGITALHNAICAGHYEIVRFLVEAGADVNAADSDGWTPLHCAASCNNLPMVKFLVERGSCAWATTLSDAETPADKCEEDEDGFQGCHNYLLGVLDQMGRIHGGTVYAAYSYDAARDDEVAAEEGDSMEVLSRSAESAEETWWLCRRPDGTEGFLPRNFLGLYPRLAHQTSPERRPAEAEEEGTEELAALVEEPTPPSPTLPAPVPAVP